MQQLLRTMQFGEYIKNGRGNVTSLHLEQLRKLYLDVHEEVRKLCLASTHAAHGLTLLG